MSTNKRVAGSILTRETILRGLPTLSDEYGEPGIALRDATIVLRFTRA